jgi:hypothetical protein
VIGKLNFPLRCVHGWNACPTNVPKYCLTKKWLNQLQDFLCLIDPPQGGNIKHHWWNNKNKCHVAMLNVSYTNLYKRSYTSQTFASHDLVMETVWFFFIQMSCIWNMYEICIVTMKDVHSFSYCMKKNHRFICASYVF